MKAVLIDCADCGHCVDLKVANENDSPELTAARNLVAAQMITWLDEAKPKPDMEFSFLQ